jgi:hypothetical protein
VTKDFQDSVAPHIINSTLQSVSCGELLQQKPAVLDVHVT